MIVVLGMYGHQRLFISIVLANVYGKNKIKNKIIVVVQTLFRDLLAISLRLCPIRFAGHEKTR